MKELNEPYVHLTVLVNACSSLDFVSQYDFVIEFTLKVTMASTCLPVLKINKLKLHWILSQHCNCEWTSSFFILKVIMSTACICAYRVHDLAYVIECSNLEANGYRSFFGRKTRKCILCWNVFDWADAFLPVSQGRLDLRGFVVVSNRDLINFPCTSEVKSITKGSN